MNSITLSSLTKSVFENRFMSSLLALAVWTAGAVSGSLALMVIAGVVAYGRPLLYSALLNSEKKAEKSANTGFGSFASIRPSAVGTR